MLCIYFRHKLLLRSCNMCSSNCVFGRARRSVRTRACVWMRTLARSRPRKTRPLKRPEINFPLSSRETPDSRFPSLVQQVSIKRQISLRSQSTILLYALYSVLLHLRKSFVIMHLQSSTGKELILLHVNIHNAIIKKRLHNNYWTLTQEVNFIRLTGLSLS